MGQYVDEQGFFSVLRWRLDSTRDEAKNIAVILVDREGEFGGIRAAPLSAVSRRLHDQGILDSVIVGLENQFAKRQKPTLDALNDWHGSMQRSLYLTEPKPTAVHDVDLTLSALYRAFVAPPARGSRVMTKGRVLDKVVATLRRHGLNVRRGTYLKDFLFDAIVDTKQGHRALEVLSFATTAQSWTPVEHDAGHFLFALQEADLNGIAVIHPPSDESHQNAVHSYRRVTRWFDKADVPSTLPDKVGDELVGAKRLF
jgi:hypothetical protein